MRIHIHRGQNQIGGSIIEISSDNTRIIFDIGINLDEGNDINIPDIDGLFNGEPSYDAIVVSHYHSDHVGLLNYVLKDIPVYMGKKAHDIMKSANEYMGRKTEFYYVEYVDATTLRVGDLSVTPFRCDHSAFDSYMFLISDGNKKILYSGDFRANGRMDYEQLLQKLPQVDALIIEGTMLSRESFEKNIRESELEEIAVKALDKYKGPAFIMSSAMNVERIKTAYNIATKTDRIFLEDLYTAGVMASIDEEGMPVPGADNVKVFMTGGTKQYELLQQYEYCKIGKKSIAKKDFIMCVRPSMLRYLKSLRNECDFSDGILFYGMWKGYQEKEDINVFLNYLQSQGVKIHTLHTSGHADIETIDKLVTRIKPNVIVPVHTEIPDWYMKYGISVVIDNNEIEI